MASSSNSSSALITLPRRKNYYDVFVTFRGTDTRFNFTDHLFAALQRNGIVAFRDGNDLQRGESIAPELRRAIEASQVYIVIFSKNYASSTWCLRELEKILECSQLYGKRVLPVFYDVDPSDVRKQSGNYEKAFAEHEKTFQHDSEMVQRWREALTQVANLSGWDMCDKPQYAEIEKIIEEIKNILGHKSSRLPKDLVGMDSPIEELEKLLLLESTDIVRAVGICGMGGIGKTTLATALYGRISRQFDACCFIDDISKVYRHDGPIGAQKQILHQALGEEHLQPCNPYNATNLIQSRLGHTRALLVLDNVDEVQQLEKLAVNSECLGAGSRIIITSRDEHILKEYGVDEVYKVPLLNETDSLQLFCRKAFKRGNIISNYEELTYDILNYVDGLALAIKVLGSFLFGRGISEWRSALARLKKNPNKDIMDVLRLSFEGLEKSEKEIFLDIACFFNWRSKAFVTNVLSYCGFDPDIGLSVLIDKSLIRISHNKMIKMHSLLEELGKKIVQENSTKDLRKWSRLWLPEHFNNVMLENMEKNVEAIGLMCEYSSDETKTMAAETLSNMNHLRILILNTAAHFSGSLNYLSNELRYVEWLEYPFIYLPSSFQPNQLVELHLRCSSIKQLWEGKTHLPNLKTMDLSYSENLIKLPNFEEVPNLEKLYLEGCVNLVQMDPSIGLLRKLVSGCSNVSDNPKHLKKPDSSGSVLHSQSMSSILKWVMMPFHSLYPKVHKGLASGLLSSLPSFSFLRELNISFCGLSQIPDAIGCIRWLVSLSLKGNNFVTLPGLRELSKLVHLDLQHCKKLKLLPELPLPEHPSHDAIKHDQYRKRWGLHIYNCPELGEREHCGRLVFSWMIQFIQVNQESSACFPWIDVVVPGSDIPRWFNNQSVGDSMNINISSIVHDNNFIGLACSVVFSAPLIDPTITIYNTPLILLHFECGNTDTNNRPYCLCPVDFCRDLATVESNHMWLIYIPRESIFDYLSSMSTTFSNLDHITMKTYFKSDEGFHVELKKCGYRCVFKQDLQHFNSMMHQKNSFAQKRKFLAIED